MGAHRSFSIFATRREEGHRGLRYRDTTRGITRRRRDACASKVGAFSQTIELTVEVQSVKLHSDECVNSIQRTFHYRLTPPVERSIQQYTSAGYRLEVIQQIQKEWVSVPSDDLNSCSPIHVNDRRRLATASFTHACDFQHVGIRMASVVEVFVIFLRQTPCGSLH